MQLGTFAPTMDPARTRVAVVEQDGQIVASWGFLMVMHAEGLEIQDGHASRRVWSLLSDALHEAVQDAKVQAVMTGANSDAVRGIVTRHHAEKLGDQYVLRVPFGPFAERTT